MSKITELKNLISSLSKSEKRYFKLYSSLHIKGDQNNYVRLFDAIGHINQDNEKLIKEKFLSLGGSTKHFAYTKNYLHELILKSLNAFHVNNSVHSQLNELHGFIEHLFRKALYGQCEKVVKRAKQLALKHENFLALLSILYWEQKLINSQTYSSNSLPTAEEVESARASVLQILQEITKAEGYVTSLISRYRKGEDKPNELTIKELRKHIKTTIDEYNTLHSKSAKLRYLTYIQLLYQNINDSNNAFTYAAKALKLVKTIGIKDTQDIDLHLTINHNYLLICRHNHQYEKFIQAYQELKKIPVKTKEQEIRKFHLSIISLDAKMLMGDFKSARDEAEELEKNYFAKQLKISDEVMITFNFALFHIYFGLKEYKKALEYLNKILHFQDIKIRLDIHRIARVANLLLHYEMKNYTLVENTIRSTERYLKKSNKPHRLENIILKILRSMLTNFNSSQTELLASYKKELTQILLKHPEERINFYYFDITAWVNSKINKTSLPVEIKKQYLNNTPS